MRFSKNTRGYAMVMVIILMAILAMLSSVIIFIANNEVMRGHGEEEAMQAYYIARTGAVAAAHAWLEKGSSNKPYGEVKRVYFNVESGDFQTNIPAVNGGYFEAEIIELEGNEGAARVVSTGTVGKHSKTVSLVTYSFSNDPGWFKVTNGDGIINAEEQEHFDEDIVYLSVDQGKIFKLQNKSSNTIIPTPIDSDGALKAKTIIFSNPLEIDLGDLADNRISDPRNKKLTLFAERIVFDNLKLSYVPISTESWRSNTHEAIGELILRLPEGAEGIDGSEIGGKAGEKYGEVFFEGESVKLQNYKWYRESYLIFFYRYFIKPEGTPSDIKYRVNGSNINLAKSDFYFKDGTNLLDISRGVDSNGINKYLIPIENDDETERPSLRGIKPYYWE